MSDVMNWRLALLATSLLASGCTAMTETSTGFADGWRRARVVGTVDASTPVSAAYKDCRVPGHAPQEGARYVLASYAFGGSPTLRHNMVVPLPLGLQVSVGQTIRINVERCEPARGTEAQVH